MKKLALILCALAPLTTSLFAAEGSMTAEERAFLLTQLETSKKAMLASIEGLTPAQWTFKPAPAVWSVQECAEHIILAEEYILDTARDKVLKTPAVPRLATSTAAVDQKLVAGIQDRSQKLQAPEPLIPGTHYATPADAMKEFTARRDKTIAYVKATDDDLRVHVAPGPAGPMDAYQFLILLASHSARHTAQIREVEAHAGYPKKSASGL